MNKKKIKVKKRVVTKITNIWLDKDSIGHAIFLPDSIVTLDAAKEHFATCSKLSNGKACLVFCDIRNIKSVNHEARKYLAGDVASKLTKASAVIVGSPISRVIGNFFIGLNKPPYTIKLFTSEAKAMEWLRSLKNEPKSKAR